MPSVSGVLRLGEAQATAAATAVRTRGAAWPYTLLLLVLVVGGGCAGYFVFPPEDRPPGIVFGAGLAFLLFSPLSRGLLIARFRRLMTAKGIPLDLALRIEITDAALVYELGGVNHTAKWSAVTELFEKRGYWIFLVQSTPYYAPQRFFADQASEKTFVAAALARMSEAARQQSPDAVHFASGMAQA